jgi:hypothetical protein
MGQHSILRIVLLALAPSRAVNCLLLSLSVVQAKYQLIVPLRLLVCLGFWVDCFAFWGEAGFPAGVSGESKIVDGDGILIVSIPRRSV